MLKPIYRGYRYDQATAADTWTIDHNLDVEYPVVDCWVDISGTLTKIIPSSLTATSGKQVVVSFTTQYAGNATVI